MVDVEYTNDFEKSFRKIKHLTFKEKIKKQIKKIISSPEIGKSMKYFRKGSRELYASPFRLAYAYLKSENKIIFLTIYHKDEQ